MMKIAKHLCTSDKWNIQILTVSSHFYKFIVAVRS